MKLSPLNRIYELNVHYVLAWILANCGVWVVSGGYHWRNSRKHGLYQSQGSYPGNVRDCDRFRLSSFRFHRERGWKIDNIKAGV